MINLIVYVVCLTAGIVIGAVGYRKAHGYSVGTLHIVTDKEDNSDYMFLELNEGLDILKNKEVVVVRIALNQHRLK